jgi:DNA mismatch repair protein MutL
VVFLTIPPGMVDVNVHPQKTEVRLAQPRLVFSLIRNAVVEGLAAAPWLAASAQLSVAEPFAEPRFPSAQRTPSTSVFSGGGGRLALQSLSSALGSAAAPAESRQSELAGEPRHDPGPQTSLLAGSRYQDLRPIGQVATTYLLLEGASGLVLIDQHAAHERIVFGHLQCALAGERLPQQGLLLPVTLSLDAEEEAELSSHRDLVERFGFALSFEAGAVQVRAIPALLAGSDPARLLADLAGALVAGDGEAELERAVDAVIARLACHGSIRAGQHLDTDDIRALMVALDEAEHRSHCPHGRPFVVQLTTGSLEQWFHRA